MMFAPLWLTSVLAGCSSLIGQVPSNVALFVDRDPSGISKEILGEMRLELAQLFAPANLGFVWRTMDSRMYGETYPQIVVVRLHGACRVDAADLLIEPHWFRNGKSLGSAFVEDGRILPFAQLDCDRVVMCIRTELMGRNQQSRERIYGRALARVLAHELYHILLGTQAHAKTGIAKSVHTREDLICDSFEFEAAQLEQLQDSVPGGSRPKEASGTASGLD